MKHALRKYIAPCGSALFMVVSTMAALVVLVTAMYMSVVSSGKVQQATFSQEQAYVTSTSIGDMIYSYIASNSTSNSKFITALSGLKKGDSISTDGNGFQAFGGTEEDDLRLGAFDATITYLYDLGDQQVYDLAVTVENNDIYETSHTFIKIAPGDTPEMRRIDNFFTATGYLPTDVWLKTIITDSEVYFDNEYVKISDFSKGSTSSDFDINFDITALGTLDIDAGRTVTSTEKPLTWAIGVDLTDSARNVDISLCGTSSTNCGNLYVGRDLRFEKPADRHEIKQYTNVYVLGDFYMDTHVKLYGDLYVAGDIIIGNGCSFEAKTGDLYVGGNILNPDKTPYTSSTVSHKTWSDTSEAEAILASKMNPSVWPAWTLDRVTDQIDIEFTEANNNTVYIDSDGTLGSWSSENGAKDHFIIIDTGDSVEDVRNITVSANDDCDANTGVYEGGESFSWDPFNESRTSVITVGKGTLVINVPDDVVYQEKDRVFLGNIAWYMVLGGKCSSDLKFSSANMDNAVSAIKTLIFDKDFVVDKSDLSSTSCHYVKETATVSSNGEESSYYTCTVHDGWFDISKKTGDNDEIKAYEEGTGDSLCAGRINHSAIDSYYSGAGAEAKQSLMNFYGKYKSYAASPEKYIYPNVNIYIASDSPNARINFGASEYASQVTHALFFGYVYAPYMTFYNNSSGGNASQVRSVGGLVVSDIVLADGYGYLFAQPDLSIAGILGPKWKIAGSLADKSWRMSYGLT